MPNEFQDDIRDQMYRDQGIPYLDSDPLVGFRLGHEVWEAIARRARVYWPDDRELYLELYASFSGIGSKDPQRYRRYGERPEQSFFTEDGDVEKVDGYPNPKLWTAGQSLGSDSPGFDFQDNTVDQTIVSGSASTTIGTRFWFEIQQPDADEAVADINPIRIPAPDSMREPINDWIDGLGGEVTRVKGAVFEERFDTEGGGDFGYGHQDYHIKYEGATSRAEIMDVMEGALDFAERAARSEGG
jgi:hypothetical protein